jgi:Tfp pilus assembly protein PilV
MKKLNNKGIILIEAILALGIIVVIMTALVTALVSTISSSSFSKDQTQATSYAQEGLDIARNFKDSSYENFQELETGEYCLAEGQTELSEAGGDRSCENNVNRRFTRFIYVNQSGQDERQDPVVDACETDNSVFVASTVVWTDSKCKTEGDNCHKVELNSCFVNLYKIDPI